jgi:Tol biopolymer transport system component
MSPEQARGQPLDKRSDIWSYGCVWFEALSGRHPFDAATMTDVLAAVVGRDPDWGWLPASTPARVQWLLRRCLEKDPRRRLHDVGDARIELEEAMARPLDGVSSGLIADRSPNRSRQIREWIAWAAGLAGITAAIGAYAITRGSGHVPPAADAPAFHTSIVLPHDLRLSVNEDPSSRFALSADGRRLAIVAIEPSGESKLWVRPLGGLTAQPLAGTEGGNYPFWSADSRSIGFIAHPGSQDLIGVQSKLKRIDLESGQVRTIGDIGFNATCTWNRDDVVLFTPAGTAPIYRISADGGPAAPVTTLDTAQGDVLHTRPFFLPDGRHFLYSVVGSRKGGATDPRAVYVGSLDANEPPTALLGNGTNARFANGHLIFVRDGRLMAQPFNLERRQFEAGTSPAVLAEGVQDRGGGAAFSVAGNGAIAYQAVVPVPMQLEWLDREGRRVGTLGGVADYSDVALSRDGSRAAVSMLDPSAGTHDIWVFDVKRGSRERITSDPADDIAPVWSPTGDRLVYSSARARFPELYQTSSTSSDRATLLPVPGLDVGKFAADWSLDGNFLIFVAGGRIIARSDLWVLPLSGDRQPFAFADSASVETQPRFSPDGTWVLFTSNESGSLEVYARAVSGAGSRERISLNGGRLALWSRNGTEVFFLSLDNTIMSATVRMEAGKLHVEAIRPLFRIPYRRVRLDAYPYAVSPDGRQFLVNSLLEESVPPAISLLVNWQTLTRK